MISFESKGSFKNTERFLQKMQKADVFQILDRFGHQGLVALQNGTPIDSGLTADSWYYEIEKRSGSYSIVWRNKSMAGDTPVAILIQYGHGTGTGGYVEGRDFINPAMRPVFDKMAEQAWKEVTNA